MEFMMKIPLQGRKTIVMSKHLILDKSFSFSLEIIDIHRMLNQKFHCYDLSRQLLRSGTSIGANIEEAQGAQSKKDFIAKFHIALKEARETDYWLRLLFQSGYLRVDEAKRLIKECKEIIRIINSIIKTTKEKIAKKT